jgi:hypothetical protein
MIISVVIYYYAGPLVASPALGSASPLITKIAFGIALPTIIVAGVVNGSVACKYLYLRIWKGTNVVHQNSFKSIGSWVVVCAAAWVLSWILAEAIPNFNLFLGLIGALFGSWFSCELLMYWTNDGDDTNVCRCHPALPVAVSAQGQLVLEQGQDRYDRFQLLHCAPGHYHCRHLLFSELFITSMANPELVRVGHVVIGC